MKVTVVIPEEVQAEERLLWSRYLARRPARQSLPLVGVRGGYGPSSRRCQSGGGGGCRQRARLFPIPGWLRPNRLPAGAGISDAQAFISGGSCPFEPPRPARPRWPGPVELRPPARRAGILRALPPESPSGSGCRSWRRVQGIRHPVAFALQGLPAQVLRRRRKLEREVGPVTFEWSTDDTKGAMRSLREWKSRRSRSTGVWDRFACPGSTRPWTGCQSPSTRTVPAC